MKKIFFTTLIAVLFCAVNLHAGKRWWLSTTTSNWKNTSNWSSVSATGASGAAVPGVNDTVYFTASRTGQCTLDTNISIKRWEMAASCGTVTQGIYNIIVGSTGAVLSGGTFSGGSGTITFTGSCTISGTAFTSTSAAFSTNSNFTLSSGSFSHNGGTMKFTASCTITASVTFTMDTMEFNPSAHAGYNIAGAGTINVATLLRYTNIYQIAVSAGTIHVQGNINLGNTFSGTSAGGTGTVVLNGTTAQYIYGNSAKGYSRLPSITINKSSGTLYLVDIISTQGSAFTYTAGTVDAGTSTIYFAGNKTFSGTLSLYNICFGGSASWTYNMSTITALGDFEILGSSNAIFNGGTINVEKNILITNMGTGGGGTTSIVLTGSGSQTITGSGTAGQGRLPGITVNKSNTLILSSIISVSGSWTYTAGTVSPGTSTVAFYGTYNLDGQNPGSDCMPFYNVSINGGTRTLTGHLDCNNNFTIASGATCSAGSNTLYVGGDWNSAGTWTYGTSTVVFDGSGYNKLQGASGTVNFANVQLSRKAPGTGSARNLRLLNPVLINTSMTFNKGRVYSTTTNFLGFADNATCTVTNNDSAYVHGPVVKTGNDIFLFPLGDTTLHDSIAYHPLRITAPTLTGDEFRATYFKTAQALGSATVDSITGLSTAEHWTLERLHGTSAVTVSLSWNRNSPPASVSDLRVAAWSSGSSAWADLGNAAVTMTWPTGMYTAQATTIFNSDVATLASASSLQKYKGYATVKRKLDGGFYEVKGSGLYFRFDDEYNDQNHHLEYHIYNSANTDVAPTLVPTVNNSALSYYGDNRFKLDLYTSSAILTAGFYILEVRNEKNEPFYLRFKMN
jgi:hypothetical protein